MKIDLSRLQLSTIDLKNKKDILFVKKLLLQNKMIKDTDISNIINDDIYLVRDKDKSVGYLSISSPVVTGSGLNQISLLYGIDSKYGLDGYDEILINDISDLLLKDDNVMLVLNTNRYDFRGQDVANHAHYTLEYTDDDNMVYTRYSRVLERHL